MCADLSRRKSATYKSQYRPKPSKTRRLLFSGGASPLFMAGHWQVISRISKDSQNIFIYYFFITTFDCQGGTQGGGISVIAVCCVYSILSISLFLLMFIICNVAVYYFLSTAE